MILLEVHNRIIEELLTQQIETYLQGEKIVEVKSDIVDFDGVLFHITQARGAPFVVSIKLKFYRDLAEHGLDQILRREYGELLVDPIPNYDATVSLDFSSQLPKEEWKPLVRKIASLKRNCFAAVFEKYFDFQTQGNLPAGDQKRAVIHYREDENMYIEAKADRVTVIFATLFKDPDDSVIGRVFMEIFPEQRRNYNQAPQVIVSYRKPPDELKDTADVQTRDNVGYLTFVLSPRHIKGPARDKTIDLIHTFRNYLHYHLKCCKAYVHAHMRKKTNEFLRNLQLARPEVKKTFRRVATTAGVSPADIE